MDVYETKSDFKVIFLASCDIYFLHYLHYTWKNVILSPCLPQGTIHLPGNKVLDHPTSVEDGGKFLFEIIPGRKR